MRSLPRGGGRVFSYLFAYNNKKLDVQKTVRYNKSTENCT